MTPGQLEFLYESRQKALAAQRAAYLSDTATAIGACVSEEGGKGMQEALAQLRAISEGKDPADASIGYTDNNVIEL